MKKIAVIGSRKFTDVERLNAVLMAHQPFILVSGGAKGADQLAESFADQHQLEKIIFDAEWSRYGRNAGPIRNKRLIEACDEVIAFWDGQSAGTKQAIHYAKQLDKQVEIIHVGQQNA